MEVGLNSVQSEALEVVSTFVLWSTMLQEIIIMTSVVVDKQITGFLLSSQWWAWLHPSPFPEFCPISPPLAMCPVTRFCDILEQCVLASYPAILNVTTDRGQQWKNRVRLPFVKCIYDHNHSSGISDLFLQYVMWNCFDQR